MMEKKGKLLVLLFSAMMIFGIIGISSAAVYTSDAYNYQGVGGSKQLAAAGYGDVRESPQFTLTLNGYPTNGTGAQLIGARLSLIITEEAGEEHPDDPEVAIVIMTDNPAQPVIATLNPAIVRGWIDIPQFVNGFDMWSAIENDGSTYFIVRATAGDFDFVSARLEATTATPEPGTMMLLGSGLVGLAGWGRKKLRK